MAFDDDGAQRNSSERNINPPLVARIANQGMDVTQGLYPLQINIVQGRRIGAVAMQKRKLHVAFTKEGDRTFHFVRQAHPGGQDQRLTGLREMVKQGEVREIGRCHLVGRNAKGFEHVHAERIPWRTEIKRSFRSAIVGKLEMLLDRELKPAQQIEHVFSAQILAVLAQGALAIDLVQVPHLKLDSIRARIQGEINKLKRTFEAAVVIVTDFGDDVGATFANLAVRDFHMRPISM